MESLGFMSSGGIVIEGRFSLFHGGRSVDRVWFVDRWLDGFTHALITTTRPPIGKLVLFRSSIISSHLICISYVPASRFSS